MRCVILLVLSACIVRDGDFHCEKPCEEQCWSDECVDRCALEVAEHCAIPPDSQADP